MTLKYQARMALNRAIAPLGLALERTRQRSAPDPPTPWFEALRAALAFQPRLRIAQVGANDGRLNDPLYAFAMAYPERTQLLLIEPQRTVVPYLRANYSAHPNHIIHEGAVGPTGTLVLYAVDPACWHRLRVRYAKEWPAYRAPTGVTSASREHVRRWLARHIADEAEVEASILRMEVPSRTLREIMEETGFEAEIDALQVDAEGFDDEVIRHALDDRIRPTFLFFEMYHLSEERQRALEAFLGERGYGLRRHGANALAIREPSA